MRAKNRWIGVALGALIVSASGCQDLTAPPPPPLTVAGNWVYAAMDLSGSFLGTPVGCEYGLTMSISGTGATFAGSYRRAELVCNLFGTPQVVDGGDGEIVAGTLEGSAVRFDFDTKTIRNTGTLSSDRMSGQVEIQLVIQHNQDIDTILVTGPWSATR